MVKYSSFTKNRVGHQTSIRTVKAQSATRVMSNVYLSAHYLHYYHVDVGYNSGRALRFYSSRRALTCNLWLRVLIDVRLPTLFFVNLIHIPEHNCSTFTSLISASLYPSFCFAPLLFRSPPPSLHSLWGRGSKGAGTPL